MTNTDDRRAKATQRVPMGTLVEICGNEPGIPAFEAESVDVSARGMHVRTAYLPELNAPLVCRFEDQGREIIVEGAVAWRREGARGGEFGIQFTALDASSVEALRDLCGVRSADSDTAASEQTEAKNPPGSRVRLHIDGLGSPMKARVRGASDRGVQVGSNLEFLKVGRRLEVEDLERGAKREAFIDSVSVAIDARTQVPQLVVALRYEEAEETTPEPSVIDSEAGATHRSPADHPELSGGTASAANSDDDEPVGAPAEEVEEDELLEEGREMRGRLAVAATSAGAAMQRGGAVLARMSASAAVGVGRLFKGASQKVTDYRQRNAPSDAPRRTAPPPSGVLSAEGRHLRRQAAQGGVSEAAASRPGSPRPKFKRIAIAGGAAALLATVVVIATRSPAPPPGAQAQSGGPAVAMASAENVTQVDEQGNPAAAAKPAESPQKAPGEAAPGGGISADVPLFGPTPMATMEAAPLGPAPVGEEGAAAGAAPAPDEEAAEKAAAAASVEDEAWQGPAAAQKSAARPEDVEPWGRGRMDTPTIHRLRLDGPGAAIQGAITPTGFSVVIPGRKVMEAGGAIEKRDQRIAKVRIKNATSGAHVSFQFRDGVPGYRVRLRRDYVEFLVSAAAHSAPEASKPANSSTGAKKSTSKKNATPAGKTNKSVAQKPKVKKG
jgi:hypothetical protein